MVLRRTSLAAIAATLVIAASAGATPVGAPTAVSAGSNLGLLFNANDHVYVVSAFLVQPFFVGYIETAVSREGPISAGLIFSEDTPD